MQEARKHLATQIKIPAVNAKKYSGKDQKDNFRLGQSSDTESAIWAVSAALATVRRVFDAQSCRKRIRLRTTKPVSCIGCSKTNVLPNAKIVATGGWDGTIRSWRWNPNVGLSGGHSLSGHTDRVEFLSIDDAAGAGVPKNHSCASLVEEITPFACGI